MCAFTIPPPRRRGGRQPPTGRSLGVITPVCLSSTAQISSRVLPNSKAEPGQWPDGCLEPTCQKKSACGNARIPTRRPFAPRGDFLFDDTRQSVGGEQLQRHVGHGWRKLSVITVLRGMNSIVQQPKEKWRAGFFF
jgi:hypothetical protein